MYRGCQVAPYKKEQGMNSEMRQYLQPSATVDCDDKAVAAFAKGHAGDSADHRERAVSLYYAVRDSIRYDPYAIDLSIEGIRASATLKSGRGWCVAKAILLAACCRATEFRPDWDSPTCGTT